MHSQGEQEQISLEIEADFNEWLEKEAAERGIDLEALQQSELETWDRWRREPNAQDFETLYNSHQRLFETAGGRLMRRSNLPLVAIKSRMTQNYVKALEGYDPTRGAKLSTWVTKNLPNHIPRYLNKYSNIGRIPDDRSDIIGAFLERESFLKEKLGRTPTNDEISGEMLMAYKDWSDLKRAKVTPREIGTLRKELRADLVAEEAGGLAPIQGDSRLEQQAVYLHGSLNPQQKLILEHTYEGFNKPIIEDINELSKELEMSPQKIRALKKQIWKKLEKYY